LKPIYIFLTVIFCLGLSSCARRVYFPAIYQNDIQYMVKPHSTDSVKTGIYAAGTYLLQETLSSGGSINSGLLNIYRSHTVPNFNFSYGILGFFGSYAKDSSDTHITAGSKSFTGFGVNGSVSYYKNFGEVDWRIIGTDLVYTHESGNYLNFRRAIAHDPDVISATQAGLFTYGIFSELAIKPNQNLNVGVKLFFSKTAGKITRTDLYDNQDFDSIIGTTGSLGYKKITGHATLATTRLFTNVSFQMGLAYRF
jgi:hypothetical protein